MTGGRPDPSQTVRIAVSDLRIGSINHFPISDAAGTLLLGRDCRITSHVVEGLLDRGIQAIEVHPRDAEALLGRAGRNRSASPRRFQHHICRNRLWLPGVPLKQRLVDRHQEPLDLKRRDALQQGMANADAAFQTLGELVSAHRLRSVDSLSEIAETYVGFLVDDYDQTVGELGASKRLPELTQRSVQLSVIGMAVGVELGLDGPSVQQIGMAGMLHDVGLYVIDPRFRDPGYQLSDIDLWEYKKHPVVSTECLSTVTAIPQQVMLAIEQVHEQVDGSGYPRGLKGNRIQLYAKILNVVDGYLKLITPCGSRKAIVQHDALGVILHQARRGLFDPAVVKALLNTATLFPLGSYVELDNGQRARVIRRPLKGYAAPVLVDEDGKRIDLAYSRRSIARPVCDPGLEQMRILPDQMPCVEWDPSRRLVVG